MSNVLHLAPITMHNVLERMASLEREIANKHSLKSHLIGHGYAQCERCGELLTDPGLCEVCLKGGSKK
jgi:hypothetical protein